MKAIVLAAGKGERLGDVTKAIPKPMLELQGEKILEHNLKWLNTNGIKDVHINLHHLASVIKDYFKDGSKWGLKISYSYEENILGTAGGVKKIAKSWQEPFLVIYGDNFYPLTYDLGGFINFHFKADGIATVGLYDKKSEILKSGVVELNENNMISRFIEKPNAEEVDVKAKGKWLINTGIYLLNQDVIEILHDGYSDFGRDVFPSIVSERAIYGYVFNDSLVAIDTMELYKSESVRKSRSTC